VEERSIFKSKTFWAAIVQFIIVFIQWIIGEVSLEFVIGDLVIMVFAVFLRADFGTNLRNILNGYFQKVEFLKDGVFWTVLVGIGGSIVAWLTGVIELPAALIAVVTALVAFFTRTALTPE
jgi:Na+/citrate or Na+/malate symporter